MKTTTLYVFVFLVFSFNSYGQDVFFSQFYNSPMTLNPSLTGFSANDMQFGLNYRHNTDGLVPYATYGASGEMKLARMRFQPDVLAIGLVAVMDDFSNGAMKTFNFKASGAYHLALGTKRNQHIAMGIQLGFFQRQTDPNSFSYPAQWIDGIGYVEGSGNNEAFITEHSLNFDLNAGLFWYRVFSEKLSVFMGTSSFHLNTPKETFLGNNVHFSRRYVGHGGFKYKINSEFYLVPNMIVMFQDKAKQIAEGASLEYWISNTQMAFKLGSWYRHSDKGLIFMIGLRTINFQFAISSDFISKTQTVAQSKSTLEFSLIYSKSLKDIVNLEANPRNKY